MMTETIMCLRLKAVVERWQLMGENLPILEFNDLS
jgi:hypothetical protein